MSIAKEIKRVEKLIKIQKKLVHEPRDGRPVTTWQRRDEALLDVAKGVRRIAEEIGLNRQGTSPVRKYGASAN